MAEFKSYMARKQARSSRQTCATGDKFFIPKKWTIKDGEYVWINDTPVNMYEQIQAERDSVDLAMIIKRFESGDKDALDRVQTMYLDCVDLPTSYAQMFEQVENMKLIFSRMPLEIKDKFNNNPAMFWKKTGTPEFDQILNDWRSAELSKFATIDESPVKSVPLTPPEVIKE